MAVEFWDDPYGPDASGMLDDRYSLNPWDFVILGEFKSPGIVEVNAQPAMKFDEKGSAGRHGSSISFTGYKPTKVDLTIHIWTADQLEVLDLMIGKLWPVVTGKNPSPKALKITHPALNQIHVKKIAIVGVSPLVASGKITGGKSVKFSCIEYEPTNANAKATKKLVPPPLDPKFSQGQQVTSEGNQSVQVTPANAQPTAPSQSSTDTGPQSQSLPGV